MRESSHKPTQRGVEDAGCAQSCRHESVERRDCEVFTLKAVVRGLAFLHVLWAQEVFVPGDFIFRDVLAYSKIEQVVWKLLHAAFPVFNILH